MHLVDRFHETNRIGRMEANPRPHPEEAQSAVSKDGRRRTQSDIKQSFCRRRAHACQGKPCDPTAWARRARMKLNGCLIFASRAFAHPTD